MRLPRVKYDKRRGTWYSQMYRGTNATTGKRIKRQRDFRDAETEREAQIMSDNWWLNYDRSSGKSCDGTFGGWFSWYLNDLEGKKKDNTHRAYSRNKRNYFASRLLGKQLRDITKADVREWADGMREEGYSSSTCHNALQSFSNVFRFALAHDWEGTNVVRDAGITFKSDTKKARAMTDMEVAKIRRACKERENAAFLLLAVDIALTTGMRVGEICALMPADVDVDSATIHVNHNLVEPERGGVKLDVPKGGRSRTIAVDGNMAKRIADAIVADDVPVVNDGGKFVRPTKLSRMFSEARYDAGVDSDITFHNLRHTHATKLFAAGELLTTVSSRLGHANATTTLNIYSHVMPGADRSAAATAAAFLVE